MADLRLSLKQKWFEMTKSGIKKEDYRELSPYWIKRFCKLRLNHFSFCDICVNDCENNGFYHFANNIMTLGYPKSTDTDRILKLEHKGIEIRTGNPEWGAEPNKLYFVIKHGNIINNE